MKHCLLVISLHGLFSLSAFAADMRTLLPGVVTTIEDSGAPGSLGLSLKNIAIPRDGIVTFRSFEIRFIYDFDEDVPSFEFMIPGFLGFLSPGVSVEYDSNQFIPWFHAELDLFYFPFAFASIVIFEQPRFIPSVYFDARFGPEGDGFTMGLRVSFPLYRRETDDGQ